MNGGEAATRPGASQKLPKSNAENMAEAIREYQVGSLDKVSIIEPRGLINTGNMCYMNSVRSIISLSSRLKFLIVHRFYKF